MEKFLFPLSQFCPHLELSTAFGRDGHPYLYGTTLVSSKVFLTLSFLSWYSSPEADSSRTCRAPDVDWESTPGRGWGRKVNADVGITIAPLTPGSLEGEQHQSVPHQGGLGRYLLAPGLATRFRVPEKDVTSGRRVFGSGGDS